MTLTATPDLANVPPRIALALDGSTGTTTTIVRIDSAGNTSPVRTANPATLVGGAWVGYDYEAPFGQAVTYTATPNTGAAITSDPVTLAVKRPWLIHLGIPDLSQSVTVASISDKVSDVNQGVHVILGRPDPIVITDGVRHNPTFDVVLKTATQAQAQALAALLADASVLMLQIAYPYTDVANRWYLAISSVTTSVKSNDYSDPARRWTLSCTQTSAPAGLLQFQRTWSDVLGENASWQDVIPGYSNWRDVITDARVPGSGDNTDDPSGFGQFAYGVGNYGT